MLVGALLEHVYAMPTQSSRKRKHEPHSNPKKAWLLDTYVKSSRLNAQEFGERLA
jgi:hypothetical protein